MSKTPPDELTDEATRLQKAREHAGFGSARAAALNFGWNVSTYGAHENGRNGFRANDAQKYALAFGVRWQWLVSGDGEMLDSSARLSAPPPNAGKPTPVRSTPQQGTIPVVGRAAAGEPGKIVYLNEVHEWIPCPPELIGVEGAYATYVHGDSMQPRYFNNERVYVHPARPYGPGDFVVAQIGEGDDATAYVKQFVSWNRDKLVLHQYNPDDNIDFDSEEVGDVHLIVGSGRG